MKRWILLIATFVMATGCKRIEPGYVGIVVNMWGEDRGVQNLTARTGRIVYNPISTNVYEYPVFMQTTQWKNTEGGANEEITFGATGMLSMAADVNISYQLDPVKVPQFYVTFRNDDLEKFTHGFLRNAAKDSFNEVAPGYAMEDIYGSKMDEFLQAVRTRMNKSVAQYGVQITQLGFLGRPRYPPQVEESIIAKIKAQQETLRIQNEVQAAEANGRKKIVEAEAQAKANAIVAASITDSLMRWRQLELAYAQNSRWNGQLPTVIGSSGQMPMMLQIPSK